jgi:hypothetical protein
VPTRSGTFILADPHPHHLAEYNGHVEE